MSNKKDLEGQELVDKKPLRVKDVDFGDFSETETVNIRGVDVTYRKVVPYVIQADIADIWLKYITGMVSDKAKDKQIRNALDKVLLNIVVSPVLNQQFLKSNKCPPEFTKLALNYILDIWVELESVDSEEESEEENIIEPPNLD